MRAVRYLCRYIGRHTGKHAIRRVGRHRETDPTRVARPLPIVGWEEPSQREKADEDRGGARPSRSRRGRETPQKLGVHHPQGGSLEVELTFKAIRSLRLRVCSPDGHIRVSAPHNMPLSAVKKQIISWHGWAALKQAEIRKQAAARPLLSIASGEKYPLWGQRLTLEIVEISGHRPTVRSLKVVDDRLLFHLPPQSTFLQRQQTLERWYAQKLLQALPPMLSRWERIVGQKASGFRVRRMSSRWGSCNIGTGRLTFNSMLALYPERFCEYIVVHELCHLLEPSHNRRFYELMGSFLPGWEQTRRELKAEQPIRWQKSG